MTLDEFKARMDYLYQRVVGSEKVQDVEQIYYPGEVELLTAKRREMEGIPYAPSEVEILNEEANRVGAAHIQILG